MDDSANTSEPQQLSEASIRRLLTAVHQALDVAVPARGLSRVACLMLLEHRARIARAGIGRLICNTCTDPLDYDSEADHILHQLASPPCRGASSPTDRPGVSRQARSRGAR